MNATHISHSLIDTEHIAQEFLSTLVPKNTGATLVALYGNLGSGKTTFTQAVARILGITEHVTSPTFIIEKIYPLTGQHFDRLIHIDAYRLEGGFELAQLGWEEIVADPKNLIFLEWPEKVADILPADMHTLQFTFVDDTTRTIGFS